MAIELDHSFSTTRPIDEIYTAILDLERVVPCVEGGRVLARTGPESVRAEIKIAMGVMSLAFVGTVEVVEQDQAARRVLLAVESTEVSGQGDANAAVQFALENGGGTIHTSAHITGTAMSMGEAIVIGILDALVTDFARKFAALRP